ncbi:type II toxin-antitoxin system VapC family toxin [Halorhodospira halochloris]|uniref:type II toxin-antitoxin system VapC family toxin n=1 Tax=Halorhodospira halochloris TaxID=1052 RepID=UPI001EE7EE4A|nr:type II toxin-antitoxin system VapC family toxin [Halorhodospira halochloris]MCG5531263.1 type II toxin-antitoxin system VapC family toxin [Halorhodospira halochloris]
MALANLADYDGTAGVLVDTNVWVDCIDEVSPWNDWAIEQLQVCSERSPLHINIVIFSELLIPGPDIRALDAMLDIYDTLRTSLPWAAAGLTAAAYAMYRRRGGTKQKPLPDFFIGAHAAVSNLSVLTRDPNPYKNYFARLEVIAP